MVYWKGMEKLNKFQFIFNKNVIIDSLEMSGGITADTLRDFLRSLLESFLAKHFCASGNFSDI